eukprot:Nk52_evm9s223 gene=Nk52_evmTU9s223
MESSLKPGERERGVKMDDYTHMREGLKQLKYGHPKIPVRQIEKMLLEEKGNVGKVMEKLLHETPDKNMYSSKDENHLDSRTVKWYYKKINAKSNTVPKWIAFDVNDSLLLELKHRVITKQVYPEAEASSDATAKEKDGKHDDSVDSVDLGSEVLAKSPKLLSKFNEVLNFSFGSDKKDGENAPSLEENPPTFESVKLEQVSEAEFLSEEDLSKRVKVLNGYYEVDLEKRRCMPIFWAEKEGEEMKVMRQTWFYESSKGSGEWLPLEEERLGSEIESAYNLRIWKDNTETHVTRLNLSDLKNYVLWYSQHDCRLIYSALTATVANVIGEKMFVSASSTKGREARKETFSGLPLRRGYYQKPKGKKEKKAEGGSSQEEKEKTKETKDGSQTGSPLPKSPHRSPVKQRKVDKAVRAHSSLFDVTGFEGVEKDDRIFNYLLKVCEDKKPEYSAERNKSFAFNKWFGLTDLEMLKIVNEMESKVKRHIIFVVHGIGQSLVEYCDIVDDSMELKNAYHDIEANFMNENMKWLEGDKKGKEQGKDKPKTSLSGESSNEKATSNEETGVEDMSLHKEKIEVMFVPIQWRRTLDLDGDNGDRGVKLEDITLDGVKPLRNILHGTFLDVLHYMNERTSRAIMKNLCKEFNRAYKKFCLRFKNFETNGGKVSIVAHSLGTVLCFDLLCQENMLDCEEEELESVKEDCSGALQKDEQPKSPDMDEVDSLKFELLALHNKIKVLEAKKKKLDSRKDIGSVPEKQTTSFLDFSVTNFFALGSPLGVFITLKYLKCYEHGVKTEGEHLGNFFVLPKCENMYNVFHPYDPVGYRIEPCISVRFKADPPVLVPYHKGGKRIHHAIKDWSDGLFQGGEKLKQNLFTGISSLTSFMSKKTAPEEGDDEGGTSNGRNMLRMESIPKNISEEEQENMLLKSFNTEGRIDFMLQDSLMESQYLSAVTSHNGYWQNPDISLFIMKYLYKGEYMSDQKSKEIEIEFDDTGENEVFPPEITFGALSVDASSETSRRRSSPAPRKSHLSIEGSSPFEID